MDIQYTKEWFKSQRSDYHKSDDLLALKKRMEHLPKMIDAINEALKNGLSSGEISSLVYDVAFYTRNIASTMDISKYDCMPNSNGFIKAKTY